ncbi:MAG TPA: hypothetical protein VMI06_10570 [Terriglobia bacterium]|nr:hypothetical protein [Terriglobia bacterium]
MKNGQKKEEGEERTEAQAPVRAKDDPLTPKRNKRGALERFARQIEEVAQTEKVPTRSR